MCIQDITCSSDLFFAGFEETEKESGVVTNEEIQRLFHSKALHFTAHGRVDDLGFYKPGYITCKVFETE
jgi:hypothetical protein